MSEMPKGYLQIPGYLRKIGVLDEKEFEQEKNLRMRTIEAWQLTAHVIDWAGQWGIRTSRHTKQSFGDIVRTFPKNPERSKKNSPFYSTLLDELAELNPEYSKNFANFIYQLVHTLQQEVSKTKASNLAAEPPYWLTSPVQQALANFSYESHASLAARICYIRNINLLLAPSESSIGALTKDMHTLASDYTKLALSDKATNKGPESSKSLFTASIYDLMRAIIVNRIHEPTIRR